jgi:hypothetical protein
VLGLGLLWAALTPAVALGAGSDIGAEADKVPARFDGVRVHRDPETGELRGPTQEESARVAPGQLRKEDQGKPKAPVQVMRGSDGRLSVVLGTRGLDALVAQRDASGRLSIRHSSDSASTQNQAVSTREDR